MIKHKDIAGWSATEIQYDNEKSGFYAAIIFFVWPLLAAVSALWNYRSSWSKNILWAFIAFYGFVYAIGAESQGTDIVGYIAEVQYLHGMQMSPSDALDYFNQTGEIDILQTVLAITISRITGSQAVITLIYGIIFGFFFSRNMWFVLDRLEGKLRWITILLCICFFLVVPIWNITTFRMWTAAHIFIYGLLPYLFEGKWKGVVIASCTIFVHFSFVIPVSALYVYILFGNRMIIYFAFFVATFFVSEINLGVFNNVVETYAPVSLQERTSGYRSENYVESIRKGAGSSVAWYAQLYGRCLKWTVMGFLIMFFLRSRNFFTDHKWWMRLFCFTLLFYGIANLLSSLPSGGRYLAVANLVAVALITMYIQNREEDKRMRQLIVAVVPALLLFVIVSIRMGLYSISATAVFGNPIIAAFFSGEHISLNDVLKMIL